MTVTRNSLLGFHDTKKLLMWSSSLLSLETASQPLTTQRCLIVKYLSQQMLVITVQELFLHLGIHGKQLALLPSTQWHSKVLNCYPVHEKELLAIVRALKRWRSDLIGVPFQIYTDHKTLENLHHQKELSHRQARWMEFLSQYDGKIVYVKGNNNSVADALSRLPDDLLETNTSSQAADHSSRPISHSPEKDCPIASVLVSKTTWLIECCINLVCYSFWKFWCFRCSSFPFSWYQSTSANSWQIYK